MSQSQRHQVAALLDKKLLRQLRLFCAIFVILAILITVHVIVDEVNPLWVLAGLVPGLVIGVLLSRTNVLAWNEERQAVVSTMDTLGAVILIAYVVFLFARKKLIAFDFQDDAEIGSLVGLAVTTGTMGGRVMFTMRGVRNTVRAALGAG